MGILSAKGYSTKKNALEFNLHIESSFLSNIAA